MGPNDWARTRLIEVPDMQLVVHLPEELERDLYADDYSFPEWEDEEVDHE